MSSELQPRSCFSPDDSVASRLQTSPGERTGWHLQTGEQAEASWRPEGKGHLSKGKGSPD